MSQYPGVECDVAAVTYSFSWNYNPNWSRAFPGGAEIQVTWRYITLSLKFLAAK